MGLGINKISLYIAQIISIMNKFCYGLFFIGIIMLLGCSADKEPSITPDAIIKTNVGDISIILYDDTPLHKENFLRLARGGFYDSLLFHRIIDQFMIQTGDPRTRNKYTMADSTMENDPGYKIEPEISTKFIHNFGKIGAARESDDQNPDRKSSGSQFYIVTGEGITPERLDGIEENYNIEKENEFFLRYQQEVKDSTYGKSFEQYLQDKKFQKFAYTPTQRTTYYDEGGAPWLDFQYTIFGEVVAGFGIVSKIASVETNLGNSPLRDVRVLTIEVIDSQTTNNP
jgi:cyclophilin family peptidyl-prolyl cis-trans isomerase